MKIPLTPIRFLRYAHEQFPDKVGVVCGEHRFTYAQFAERVARLAGALVTAGARPGDRIAFLSTNCHRLLEAYYGVLEAGCVLLPLNIRLAPQELAFVLNDAQARFLFVESMFLPLAQSLADRCSVDRDTVSSWMANPRRIGWRHRATRTYCPLPRHSNVTSPKWTRIRLLNCSIPADRATVRKA